MKKLIYIVLSIFILNFTILSVAATEEIASESDYVEPIIDSLDDETLDLLKKIGLEDFTSDEVFSVSIDRICKYFSSTLSEKTENIIRFFIKHISVLLIVIIAKSYFLNANNYQVNILSSALVVFLSAGTINELLNTLLSTLKLSGNFTLSFIPIYTLLVSLAGSANSAVTYNFLSFLFAQIFSFFIDNLIVDFVGIFLAITVSMMLNKAMNPRNFISGINKITNTVIGFFGTTFTTILSVSTGLSAAIDGVSSKTTRFLIGNLIPIVGSSISDAYSTLLGSINVIKSSVAAIGIIVVLVITVPPVLEGVIVSLLYNILSYIADVSGNGELSTIFKAFSFLLKTVVLLNVLQMFMLVISTAIMLTLKGGVI